MIFFVFRFDTQTGLTFADIFFCFFSLSSVMDSATVLLQTATGRNSRSMKRQVRKQMSSWCCMVNSNEANPSTHVLSALRWFMFLYVDILLASICNYLLCWIQMKVSAMWRSPNKQTPHRKVDHDLKLMAVSLLCTLVHTSCFAFEVTFKGKKTQIFHFPGWPSLRLSLEQLESVFPMEKWEKDRGHTDTR